MSVQMLKGLHRRIFGIAPSNQFMAQKGYVSGGDGAPSVVHPSPTYVSLFDDFFESTLSTKWSLFEGDTGHVASLLTTTTNGVIRMTNSGTAIATPAGVHQLCGAARAWMGSQGQDDQPTELRMSTRLNSPKGYDLGGLFVGFTDNIAAEMPAYDTGGALFTQAADCVGFLVGEGGDTGWVAVAAKSTAGDSGDQSLALGVSPPAQNVFTTLEVVVRSAPGDTGGVATFYVDGQAKGQIDSPVAMTATLTPTVAFFDLQDTGAPQIDIDYINVSALRDTGD